MPRGVRICVLPASRKPITASTTKEDNKHDDDNYGTHVLTLVLFGQRLPYFYPGASVAFRYKEEWLKEIAVLVSTDLALRPFSLSFASPRQGIFTNTFSRSSIRLSMPLSIR